MDSPRSDNTFYISSLIKLPKKSDICIEDLLEHYAITKLDFDVLYTNIECEIAKLLKNLYINTTLVCLKLSDSHFTMIQHIPKNVTMLEFEPSDRYTENPYTQLVSKIQSSQLKKLAFHGGINRVPDIFYKYLSESSITDIDFAYINTDISSSACIEKIVYSAKLKSLYMPLMHIPISYTKLDKLEELCIMDLSIDFITLIQSTSLRKLKMYQSFYYEIYMAPLMRNTSITSLQLMTGNKCIFDNESIFISRYSIQLSKWLNDNKSLRWKYRHAMVSNITIAMFPFDLPPYVLLEIIDWIYKDNPYSTHYKKIMLIINLYKSMKDIILKH